MRRVGAFVAVAKVTEWVSAATTATSPCSSFIPSTSVILFEKIRSKSICTIELVIFHIFYATQRISQYAEFTREQDCFLILVINKAVMYTGLCHPEIELARLENVRPYEAFAGKSCRMAEDFMTKSMPALEKLYTECVLPVCEFDERDNVTSPEQQSFEKVCYSAMLKLSSRCRKVAAQLENPFWHGSRVQDASISKHLKHYQKTMKNAYKHYTTSMDELVEQWSTLDSDYKLWNTYTALAHRQALTDLIFRGLRLTLERQSDIALQTVHFPTIQTLQQHYDLMHSSKEAIDNHEDEEIKSLRLRIEEFEMELARKNQATGSMNCQ